MSLAPVDIFIRVGYRFLLSTIVNLYPSNSTRLHFRYSTYRITHVSLVPFHTSQPENCSTDVCNFILLSVTHYTLLRKVVRPCREERKNEDRRSALARRDICPLRRKMSLLASAYSLRPLSLGCQRAYPRSCGSAVSLGHPDNIKRSLKQPKTKLKYIYT